MSRKEVLELLKQLLQDSFVSKSHPDDHSGCSTVYLVDHEFLMGLIEQELAAEDKL